ncbi:helix-turn-helix transcriptional regulator [Hornefia butyriciproducens]|uniref:helix-turn-helix transcriptional regulator n=1 Tax=Hornefia butyriciproducens TaxID=2652293 RepID=UPI002A90E48C|nr:helix-turn-helix transcriptional regulator [Hornefia butyriciproducens]MDY5463121.1 helix-turn-helix transcriptional regulator [Hornefia butyriciproducens]
MKNKIRERRIELEMSQDQLSSASGVARTVISQLENGTREVITSDTMLRLAKALDCSVADIFLLD